MRIDILTLFPKMFAGYFEASMLGRAQESRLLELALVNIRDFAMDRHKITDEPPFGGGGGMILKPEPIFRAVESLVGQSGGMQGADADSRVAGSESPITWPIVLLTPQGRPFNHEVAHELAQQQRLTLVCGRYEGIDERVRQRLVTDEISIGDYGVLGAAGAADSDSHATGLLEGPHYTRPAEFRGWAVPEVLRSGHEAHIQRWRREQALRRTWQRRPELLLTVDLNDEDKRYLALLAQERAGELGHPLPLSL
jgi:tRNA (guanine37-N1)-methyltransferase